MDIGTWESSCNSDFTLHAAGAVGLGSHAAVAHLELVVVLQPRHRAAREAAADLEALKQVTNSRSVSQKDLNTMSLPLHRADRTPAADLKALQQITEGMARLCIRLVQGRVRYFRSSRNCKVIPRNSP